MQEAAARGRPARVGADRDADRRLGRGASSARAGLSAVGAVVGATQPEAVARARELMPHQSLLLPGRRRPGRRGRGDLHAASATHPAGGLIVAVAVGDLRVARPRRRLAAGRAHAPRPSCAEPRSRCDRRLRGRPRARDASWRVLGGGDRARAATAAIRPPTRKGDGTLGDRGRPRRRGGDPRPAAPRPGPTTTCSARRTACTPPRGGAAGPARRTWVVDPIDGTHSYMIGIPLWATLVGLRGRRRGRCVGVCHAPGLGETYEAADGGGARMNGEPIARSRDAARRGMVVSAGPSQHDQEHGLERLPRAVRAAAGACAAWATSGATCWSPAARPR